MKKGGKKAKFLLERLLARPDVTEYPSGVLVYLKPIPLRVASNTRELRVNKCGEEMLV